jgi:hypothetical protein
MCPTKSKSWLWPVLFACAALILPLVAAAPGCAVAGYLGHALFEPKIKAAHTLADRPTLVIVDDPRDLLHDASLLHEMAHGIGRELENRHVLKQVVSGRDLADLESRMAAEYRLMPIDRIGSSLGAEQVLHVNVDNVEAGYGRITLSCRVRVFDVEEARQLFPAGAGSVDATAASMGLVRVAMPFDAVTTAAPGASTLRRRALGERVSISVARLFHDHEPPSQDASLGRSPV